MKIDLHRMAPLLICIGFAFSAPAAAHADVVAPETEFLQRLEGSYELVEGHYEDSRSSLPCQTSYFSLRQDRGPLWRRGPFITHLSYAMRCSPEFSASTSTTFQPDWNVPEGADGETHSFLYDDSGAVIGLRMEEVTTWGDGVERESLELRLAGNVLEVTMDYPWTGTRIQLTMVPRSNAR